MANAYNRILAKRPGFYRVFRTPDGDPAVWFDARSVGYLSAELVALSATDIALAGSSPAIHFLPALPRVLRDRVVVLDQDKVAAQVDAFLKPAAREFGLSGLVAGHVSGPSDMPPEFIDALGPLLPGLYDFLLGATYKLQIELDVPRVQAAARAIRRLAVDQDTIAHMAAFEGVLNTYQASPVPSLQLVSAASKEQEQRFQYLIEDLAYRNLSEDAAMLGIPADFERAVQLMGRAIQALLKRPALAKCATAASKALLASQGLNGKLADAFDLDLAKALLADKYFPPIVSLNAAYDQALVEWSSTRLPADQVPEYAPLLAKGWVEQPDAPQPSMDHFQAQPPDAFLDTPPGPPSIGA
jgi:hypothetical protein